MHTLRMLVLGALALATLAAPLGCSDGDVGDAGGPPVWRTDPGPSGGEPAPTFRLPRVVTREVDLRAPGDVPYVGLFADDRRVSARLGADGAVEVEVALYNGQPQTAAGTLHVALRHLDGTLVDQQSAPFAAPTGFTPVRVTLAGLPADAELADLSLYALDYELQTARFPSGVFGRRSLFEAVNKLEIQVLTAERYPAGEQGFVRLFARNPASGAPAADAQVTVSLQLPDGTLAPLASGRTDRYGALGAALDLPETFQGQAKLVVAIEDESGVDTAEADVAVLPDVRILLTSDKPMYQPGQTMHLRALVLNRATKEPYAGGEVVFEVADAAGNKVFKERQTADEYGIAATTFQLATQVNMGQFRVKAIVPSDAAGGEAEIEKEVTVERYTLPKYKVEATLDQPYYLPGETVRGTVSAQYFFGQSVAGGAVTVVASTYDIGFTPFATLTGFTNAEGLYSFEFTMPQYVVGQPLEQGNGLVKIDVTVKDTADQEQSISRTTVVSRADVEVTLVPESGELVPGVDNVVYVVVSDPMGGAVEGEVTATAEGVTSDVELDAQGLGVWSLKPTAVPVEASVTVQVPGAEPVTLTETLAGGGAGHTILLRTDAALYQVGDTVQATVLLPAARARVFLDVIHAGRTVATAAIDVVDGVGRWHFEADNALEGALQLHAYFLGEGSEIVRDERLIYVDPADALTVRLVADQESYLPGDPARVAVEVTDAEGQPKAAALGVQVVDEAVYALQEVQPGLLKVYFELEDMLTTPKYQFAWPDLDPTSVIEPPEDGDPVGGGTVDADRARRAEVAFAAQAGGQSAYGVDVNTQKVRLKDVAALMKPFLDAQRAALVEEVSQRRWNGNGAFAWDDVAPYVEALYLEDPWLRPYRFVETDVMTQDEGDWWWFEGDNHVWDMISDGPDERPGTADDLVTAIDTFELYNGYDRAGGGWVDDGDWMGGGPPEAGAEDPAAPTDGHSENGADGGNSGPRVRRWFPETLFVDPAVITDASGRAEIALTMADSITSWRLTALANSADGLLGSATSGLTVFQDFFVDIVFPATLTRGDVVSVPVAIYNYLDIPQTVTLTAQDAEWLTFLNGAEVTVPLEPGQVDSIYFDVQVDTVGPHALTVVALGTAQSDAIERTVLVEPDGKKFEDTASARFHTQAPADQIATEEIVKTVTIPEANIDGAQKLLVKVYPGFFSQAVEGLDSMFQMPGGCLEQTTSTAWPNVLVMDYMIQTETITPEIEMKAQQLVNLGYQRILTFECASGGFNWWEGDDPGNAVLSALVAMQLTDASHVTFVDTAVIQRTQDWLVSVQQSNGSWTEERHLHAGNENLGGSSLRATAYILWGLVHSGYEGPAVQAAVNWIVSEAEQEEDLYTLAMVANGLSVAGYHGALLDRILRTLHDARVVDEDGSIHWAPNGDTMVGSWGGVADIETTALVGLAFLHSHTYPQDVEGAITWLVAHKDPNGNWGYSTQATVLTLKLLLESLGGDAGETDADVTVLLASAGGEPVEIATRHFDNFNKDVLWQVDLSELTIEGDNEVTLRYSGLGNLMYQLVASYNLPWEESAPSEGPVSISVEYDKTQLAVNDTVTVTVTVTLHDASQRSMVLVDLGRPPGFTLATDDLAALREAGVIAEYEFTDRQILIYLDPLTPEEPKAFSYRLTADYPIEATVPGSTAAPYYNAEDETETPEFGIEVR